MRFILAISIISISTVIFLTGFAPRKFCAGFQRGYTVGYQRWIGTDKSTTFPRCPSPDHKMSGGREAGYLIGFMQGMADGERNWATRPWQRVRSNRRFDGVSRKRLWRLLLRTFGNWVGR